jgi:predicted negative regulator of RcsB-dependent stress response
MKKDDLRQPDAFIATSNNLLHYVEKHALPIFSILAAAIVISLGYLGVNYWNSHKENQAAAHIYEAESKLKQVEKDIEKDRTKRLEEMVKSAKGKVDPKLAETIRPENFDADYLPRISPILTALQDVHESKAALLSAMSLVNFLGEKGKWKLAQDVIKIPTFKPKEKELLFGLTQMHRGLVALENGQADEAIAYYQSIIANPAQKILYPEAYLKMGISFELKKDFKKAKEIYQRITVEYATSDSATEAEQFLKLLELKGAA